MKYLLPILSLLILSSSTAFSQIRELPVVGSHVTYKIESECKSTKDQIYLVSKDWATSAFKNFKEVVQLDDKELGKINLNGNIPSKSNSTNIYKYRIAIECAEGRYRFSVSDIVKVTFRPIKETIVESIYLDYLKNNKSILSLRDKSSQNLPKRESKKIKEELFNRETDQILLNREVKDIDACMTEILDSYKRFAKAL